MKKVLEQQGILNVDAYLTRPDMLPPPQPDPMQQMQVQMATQQMQIQERQTAVAEQKAATQAAQAQAKLQLDREKATAQYALQSDQQDLREDEFAHKQRIDEGELEMLRNTEETRWIISPTG